MGKSERVDPSRQDRLNQSIAAYMDATSKTLWSAAIVVSIVIAAIGLFVATMTVVDVFKGRLPARTIWGLLVIVAGILSPVFTGLLVICKRRFIRLQRPPQWLVLIAVPCGYLLLLVLLMHRSLQSSTTIFPLPFRPTLSIGIDDDGMLVCDIEPEFARGGYSRQPGNPYTAFVGRGREFDAQWSESRRQGVSWSVLRLLVLKSRLIPRTFLPHVPGQSIAALGGTIRSRGAYGVDVVMHLTVSTTIQLRVDGLDPVEIVCHGRDAFDPARIEPGHYRIVITGKPRARGPYSQGAQAGAIADIETMRGKVKVDGAGAWDVDLGFVQLDIDCALEHLKDLGNVKHLSLRSTKVADAQLEHLKSVASLQVLDLRDTQVTDAGLEHLKRLTGLQGVDLSGTQVTDAGISELKEALPSTSVRPDPKQDAAIAEIRKLGGQFQFEGNWPSRGLSVFLGWRQVTDADLKHLKGLTGLQLLCLDGTQVKHDGLEHLKGLGNLQELHLDRTQLTDAGLEHLKGLDSLQKLRLSGTQVTDAGLEYLKGLDSLQELRLASTHVTDAGLEHLKGLDNLQELRLGNTQVTDAGVDDLKKALPNVRITH